MRFSKYEEMSLLNTKSTDKKTSIDGDSGKSIFLFFSTEQKFIAQNYMKLLRSEVPVGLELN